MKSSNNCSLSILVRLGIILLSFAGADTSSGQGEPALSGSDGLRRVSAIAPDATVDDLVAFAVRRHPSITQMEARVRRMLEKVPQAGALPDPKIRFSGGSMAETAAGRVDWMTAVEQALPFPGKLRRMAAAAGKDADAAAMQLEAMRVSLAAEVRTAYWDCFLATRTIEVTEASRSALGLVRDSVDARVIASQANLSDQLRLATEFGRIEKVLIESRQAKGSARARLNALMNRPAGAALPEPVAPPPADSGDVSTLLARAEDSHPDVRAAGAEIEASELRLEKARLDRFPDFMIGVQHAAIADAGLAPMANGRDQLIAMFGLSIPLWQEPRLSRMRDASAGIEESRARRESARAGLRFKVEDAWLKMRAATELIALLEKQLLPESRQAFDAALTAYAAGTRSFIDVLDAWRQHLALQLQQAGHQAHLGKATTALRSAVGDR